MNVGFVMLHSSFSRVVREDLCLDKGRDFVSLLIRNSVPSQYDAVVPALS
jgi:hypothetical protein